MEACQQLGGAGESGSLAGQHPDCPASQFPDYPEGRRYSDSSRHHCFEPPDQAHLHMLPGVTVRMEARQQLGGAGDLCRALRARLLLIFSAAAPARWQVGLPRQRAQLDHAGAAAAALLWLALALHASETGSATAPTSTGALCSTNHAANRVLGCSWAFMQPAYAGAAAALLRVVLAALHPSNPCLLECSFKVEHENPPTKSFQCAHRMPAAHSARSAILNPRSFTETTSSIA